MLCIGSKPVRSPAGGFTLIEILVVVAIIALLAAILLPSLSHARQATRATICLSNLRQFVMAANVYTYNHKGRYPIAYHFLFQPPSLSISYAWDFTTIQDWSIGTTTVKPGLLWQGCKTAMEIQQCPSFEGGANWMEDPYTGYNYNTSYIGHGSAESIPEPARVSSVRRPALCAIFGDGQWQGGANKFMRAPFKNPGDESFSGRHAGTQGYRHLGKTKVAFCDGHAQSKLMRYTETYEFDKEKIADGTGFLSPDNSLYDLE